jgi:hypothetical protein
VHTAEEGFPTTSYVEALDKAPPLDDVAPADDAKVYDVLVAGALPSYLLCPRAKIVKDKGKTPAPNPKLNPK